MKEPFLSAVPVLKILEDAGFQAYFVGGSVRDYLLGKQISDVDIATSATPDEVKTLFKKTIDIGIEHGTVLVLHNQNSYEITTFRTEGEYQDYRRPKEVAFIRSLTEDLKRRDFTMNAIAMDLNGNLIDPFGGQNDIHNKLIQTVGLAKERFHEDALRMLRAVRFASQLSFQIDTETLMALSNLNQLLSKIAVERKRAEFEKLLMGKNRKNALKILVDANLHLFLPGLEKYKKDIMKVIEVPCERLSRKEMWCLLLYYIEVNDADAEPFLREWRLPLKDIKDIRDCLYFTRQRLEQNWSIYQLYIAGYDTIQSAEKLTLVINGIQKMDSVEQWLDVYKRLPIKTRSDLDVTGSDLIEWSGKTGGPWLKQVLLQIEKAVLEGNVANEKQKIKEWLKQCSQK
ncbi:CCA tRNA nucleotidyltransferase [Neobacillus dielmonensis]|uniref:CCA tRNA nucleotidyltransferase n=1 Tax=Neobacillus dielmonensis TaxID=1347369 RepID=UPI0005A63B3A|nr:CCA tRNA nucleotidyltransferase [Neobacillus dielmonensis]